MVNRKVITFFDEDIAITILKPYSSEHNNKYYVIYEDAYGEIIGTLLTKNEITLKFNLSNEELNEFL
jgi:hypothetical protein